MYFVSIIYNQYQASATHCYLRIFYAFTYLLYFGEPDHYFCLL